MENQHLTHSHSLHLQEHLKVQVCHLHIEVQDWVFLRVARTAQVARVGQMAIVQHVDGIADVYLWCLQCYDACRLLEDPDGLMRIPRVGSEVCGLVRLSRVSISALVCEVRADHLEFRYVF